MRWKRSMIGIRQPESWIGLFGGRDKKWSGWLAQWRPSPIVQTNAHVVLRLLLSLPDQSRLSFTVQ
jgi:hypothetical protein